MCLGSEARLAAAWQEDGVPAGRLDDGRTVPLLYVPGARAGARLLLHLGIPVEILEPDRRSE